MVLAAIFTSHRLFLGLEILSVALYALISYLHGLGASGRSRYQVSGIGRGISRLPSIWNCPHLCRPLLTMEFARIAQLLTGQGALNLSLLLPGVALIVTGIGFKLALVPFHMWTPDVYEGAPAPVTAFVATVSKGGMFALLLRYFHQSGTHSFAPVVLALSIIAVASMFAGNLLALLQNNVKRILAYSSIAHTGYLLVAFQVGGPNGRERRRLLPGRLLCDDTGRFWCGDDALRARERCGSNR